MRRHRRVAVRIPAAAMADLALLLLIFFLTTTYFQAEEGPRLELPVAAAGGEESEEGTWSLHLGADGMLRLQGEDVSREEAAERVGEARRAGRVARLLFYAERSLPFVAVYPVLEALRGEVDLPVLLMSEPASPEENGNPSKEGA